MKEVRISSSSDYKRPLAERAAKINTTVSRGEAMLLAAIYAMQESGGVDMAMLDERVLGIEPMLRDTITKAFLAKNLIIGVNFDENQGINWLFSQRKLTLQGLEYMENLENEYEIIKKEYLKTAKKRLINTIFSLKNG